MKAKARKSCPNCRRLQALLDAQEARLKALEAAVARLQEQLAAARKDSSTSSKPPSSDVVKPPPPAGQDNPRGGGQPGHPIHERALFPTDQIDRFLVHPLRGCPCCGGQLCLNGQEALVVQQVDLQPAKLTIEQHTCPEYWCACCERSYKAALPKHVSRGGLVGPRLTTLIAYLKGFCHASFSTVRLFLRDVVGVTISRGQLSKIITKVSDALDGPYQELLGVLPAEAILNVDETGHKDNGNRMWTWCFRASLYTLFKIDATRLASVLIEVLGKDSAGCWAVTASARTAASCVSSA